MVAGRLQPPELGDASRPGDLPFPCQRALRLNRRDATWVLVGIQDRGLKAPRLTSVVPPGRAAGLQTDPTA